MQYTIRNIPAHLDARVREVARNENLSLNQAVIEVMSRGVSGDRPVAGSEELASLSGSWVEDPAFDEAMESISEIDEELWT
jgi:hypothetical protein